VVELMRGIIMVSLKKIPQNLFLHTLKKESSWIATDQKRDLFDYVFFGQTFCWEVWSALTYGYIILIVFALEDNAKKAI